MTNSVQEPSLGSRPAPQGCESPVDTCAVTAAVDRALAHGPLPRYEVLVALEVELRGHIRQLLPHGWWAVTGMQSRSAERQRQTAFLRGIPTVLARGLGPGLVSARNQCADLGRACRDLLALLPAGADR